MKNVIEREIFEADEIIALSAKWEENENSLALLDLVNRDNVTPLLDLVRKTDPRGLEYARTQLPDGTSDEQVVLHNYDAFVSGIKIVLLFKSSAFEKELKAIERRSRIKACL